MKYAFIQRHRRVWPISVQCRVLEVSVAGYHEHFVRRASDAQRRHLSDDALLVHIKAIHAETHGGYGWPRTWKELRYPVGHPYHAAEENSIDLAFALTAVELPDIRLQGAVATGETLRPSLAR